MNYYNEFEPYAAEWLKNLIKAGHIPDGEVDTRSIVDVQSGDLKGFTQCHFFAGIGGWPLALKLAGWSTDRPVWTGSCPCQPFSSIGKQTRQQDERHLWPDWYRLIRKSKPPTIFGEQVDEAITAGWLDEVLLDLEKEGYACAAAVLSAYSVKKNHERNRIFYIANSKMQQGVHESNSKERSKRLHNDRINGLPPTWDEAESKVYSIHDGFPSFVGEFKGFGNAIQIKVASEFIESYLDMEHPNEQTQ